MSMKIVKEIPLPAQVSRLKHPLRVENIGAIESGTV